MTIREKKREHNLSFFTEEEQASKVALSYICSKEYFKIPHNVCNKYVLDDFIEISWLTINYLKVPIHLKTGCSFWKANTWFP